MSRGFISSPTFDRVWEKMGLGDRERAQLECLLLENPSIGDVIPEMEGARKVRFALEGKGKSGGARVIYLDIVVKEQIHLILAYPKNAQENMKPEQKKLLLRYIKTLKAPKKED